MGAVLDIGLFLGGGILLVWWLRRWWRPGLARRVGAGYVLLTAAFFAGPLATERTQLPTDTAYLFRPWVEETHELVEPQNPLLGDVWQQMLPFRALVRRAVLSRSPPLWAHELGTGQPLLANGQSAPLAPLHLLSLPLPPQRGMTVAAAWQVLVALLLTHMLVVRLGGTAAGGALAAVSFALSGFMIAWLYHPHAMAAAFLPGLLLAICLLRDGARGGFGGVVACTTLVLLAGHPSTAAHIGVAAAAVMAASAATGPPGGRLRFLTRALGAAALGAALAAPAILPILEAVPRSDRVALLQQSPRALHPRFDHRLPRLLVHPFAYGSPRDGNWTGPWNFNETATHAGLLTLALAVAAAAGGLRRPAWVLLGGGLALAAAFGARPLLAAVTALPLLEHGTHGRLRLLWVLAVAVAAGLGLGRIAERPVLRAAASGAVAIAMLGLLTSGAPAPPWQLGWWWVALVGCCLALASLLIPAWRRAFAPLCVGAVLAELFAFGVRYHPVVLPDRQLQPPEVLSYLIEEQRVAAEPFRILAEGADLPANLAAYFGLWDPRVDDPMRPLAPLLLTAERFTPGFRAGRLVLDDRPFDRPLHAYLGIRYFLTGHHRRLSHPWVEAFRGVGGRVWENPQALGIFFFPAEAVELSSQAAAHSHALTNEDFAAAVAVEGPAVPSGPQTGTARVVRSPPNGFVVEVASSTGGVVASSVTADPGWRLRRAPEGSSLLRVNGAFVGVALPEGEHRIELRYSPTSWRSGLLLAALASLLLLGTRFGRQR
jgi:hypothetical protein